MEVGSTHAAGRRVFLAFACLVIAPILGIWAGGSMPNPPGNGPGEGQLLVGVAVPVFLTSIVALVARIGRVEAALWATASLVLTGGLVLVVVWHVETYFPT